MNHQRCTVVLEPIFVPISYSDIMLRWLSTILYEAALETIFPWHQIGICSKRSVSLYPYNRSQILQYVKYAK